MTNNESTQQKPGDLDHVMRHAEELLSISSQNINLSLRTITSSVQARCPGVPYWGEITISEQYK